MAIIKRHKSSIMGLVSDLDQINNDIAQEAATRALAVGTLADLATSAKTNLVVAINEVKGLADAAGDTSGTALQKANNLSDLSDVTLARIALSVYSQAETDNAIRQAKLDLGTNFNVANIAARDAMADLDTADRVFVQDAGDGKWAIFIPEAVNSAGAPTGWIRIGDQESLENAVSAAGIKAAYESNPDTNAYTDADKAKLGLLTVPGAIDLGEAVLRSALTQTLEGSVGAQDVPSAAAVVAYFTSLSGEMSLQPKLENVTVSDGEITLAHAPKDGIHGIMNFGTVRYLTAEGIAYDAPVVATTDPKVFSVSTDTANQWDGNSVQIQYLHLP